MNIEWIIIETLAVFTEVTAYMFFVHSRYQSKITSKYPQIISWILFVSWGLYATFNNIDILIYDSIVILSLLLYMLIVKEGTILNRIFGVLFTFAIFYTTTIIGAGIATALTSTTFQHSLEVQGFSRLIAIVFIKMTQIIAFYLLAKRPVQFRGLKKRSVWVLTGITTLCFLCVVAIWILVITQDIDENTGAILTFISAGLLLLLILLFVMYELFIREENRNISLQSELQMMELQSHFYTEIDAMYRDMRKWRHDYKNNLSALRALVETEKIDSALSYIDSIANEPLQNQTTLQTGDTVLDAIVSSKLWLAKSLGIEVSIQAVYPEVNIINDNDLCTIAGNLLDNAIEACQRMESSGDKRFIEFSLLLIGKNLSLSVSNSYDGEIKIYKGRYHSTKKGSYHGMGIQLVDSVVDKYQGCVMREHNLGIFTTKIMLPLVKQGEG